ncbi:Rieske 2Fe-2S domain-containing protein [Paraburkholderia sp. CNPSo 3274]|uniref:Rieske (2Fe-2S) protein n=1 Tax=Paraburkholderia sp. CNPSo 3274 TaxID=2940932 RepID=UPI0020B8C7F2|nr:Rieske 2Fe-2S domain-containing protein [Paraburkholderia sp. CNPSo 3274]MCP3709300.1 Rieske 2Fe-2S domain-containing protein [Paraburkholderia sp. CNPSo 3274]
MTEDLSWIDVMDSNDLWIGEMVAVESVFGPLLMINIDGAVRAYENRCPHMGARLSDGEFANGVIVCPNHRWEFCAHSGRGINPAGKQLNPHRVRIVGGRILVASGQS